MSSFIDKVKKSLALAFAIEDLPYCLQSGYLTPLIEGCFQIPSSLRKEKKAECILRVVFSLLVPSFRFEKLFQTIQTRREKREFLTQILYRFYFNDLSWQRLKSREALECQLFQWLAALATPKTIKTIWKGYSFSKRITIILSCSQFLDEGGYRILKTALFPEEKLLQEHLEKGYIDLAQKIKITKKRLRALLQQQRQASETKIQKEIGGGFSQKTWEQYFDIFGASRSPSALEHLYALEHDPKRYEEGLDSLVFAMPTREKDLSRLPWLPSMSEALKKICSVFHLPLQKYPLFVFDQSHQALFKKNSAYSKKLEKESGVTIVHLDTAHVLSLAKQLGVEGLIATTNTGKFGFGGSRNAVFLLAPLLLAMRRYKGTLSDLFSRFVLDSHFVVSMGDDDIHVPAANIFSDALFASTHKDEYFCQFAQVVGRETQNVYGCLDPSSFQGRPQEIILQERWEEKPYFHGMSGLLTKPKLCLNLPHGQEEAEFEPIKQYYCDTKKPYIHLAGVRYPKAVIPVNRFSGLHAFLKKQNSYALQLLQVAELIDPLNYNLRSALPWNLRKEPFSSLREAIQYIIHPKTEEKMQKQFWENCVWYARGFTKQGPMEKGDPTSVAFSKMLPDENVRAFRDLVLLVAKEHRALDDARHQIEKTYKKKLEDLPLAYFFFLMCHSIGEAGFQQSLKKIRIFSSKK
jgi:hypothetical protein